MSSEQEFLDRPRGRAAYPAPDSAEPPKGGRRGTSRGWQAELGDSVAYLWSELRPPGRLAVFGSAVAGLAVLCLALVLVPGRGTIVDARGEGLKASVAPLEASLALLDGGDRLTERQLDGLDALIGRTLGSAGYGDAVVWTLDGTVIYAESRALIGQIDVQRTTDLARAAVEGRVSEVAESETDGGAAEVRDARLLEHLVPLAAGDGKGANAVLGVREDIGQLDRAVGRAELWVRGVAAAGLGLLLLCVLMLLITSRRLTERHRNLARARAREFEALSAAADTVASSFDPNRLFRTLRERIATRLQLDRFAVRPAREASTASLAIPLRNGSVLAADRSEPFTDEEKRILQTAALSLDAAVQNTKLFEEVRVASQERQRLIRDAAMASATQRKQLVGELHDSLASELVRTLYAVRRAELVSADQSTELKESLVAVEDLLVNAEGTLRAFLGRLRPDAPDFSDVTARAREVVTRFERESGIPARLRVRGEPNASPSRAQEILVRALEEGLLNVEKHSGARRVCVLLSECGGYVRLAISDDGKGWPNVFAAETGRGLGLTYLRERVAGFGGTLRIGAGRRGGARLDIRVPIIVETE